MQVSLPPPAVQGACSELQQSVIQHCRDTCERCDAGSVGVVLAQCTIGGVAQAQRVTFCSSERQHNVVDTAASSVVTLIALDTAVGYTTYQLSLLLHGDAVSVFSIYGDAEHPLTMPPAYQVVQPSWDKSQK